MRLNHLFATACFLPLGVLAQNKEPLANRFEALYNGTHYDSVFLLFSHAMKQALPPQKTVSFLKGLYTEAGKIKERQFVRDHSGFAEYKTRFERGLFSVHIAVDDSAHISGLMVRPFRESNLPQLQRNISELALPFQGQWTVVWGGDTKELNYHVESEAQRHAFDLVITDSLGKSYRNNGGRNEDYYAFGKPLHAPARGEVVLVVDGVPDNNPGTLNPMFVPGNTVIIKTENGEYLFLAHFKQHSIRVRQGQQVKQGQILGLCGNSGRSSEPHLHFHIQNTADMNVATGVKCYFKQLKVNGVDRRDYSPVKGEKIAAPDQ